MQDTIELNQYFKEQFEKLIDANCVAYVNVIEVRMRELELLYHVTAVQCYTCTARMYIEMEKLIRSVKDERKLGRKFSLLI